MLNFLATFLSYTTGALDSYEKIIESSMNKDNFIESEYTVNDIWNEYKDDVIVKCEIVSSSFEITKRIALKINKTQKAVRLLLLQRKHTKIKDIDTVEEADILDISGSGFKNTKSLNDSF